MVDVDEGRNDDALLSLLFVGNTSLLLYRIDVAKENVKKLLWNMIGMIIVLSSIGKIGGYIGISGGLWQRCRVGPHLHLVLMAWVFYWLGFLGAFAFAEFPKDIRANWACPILFYKILLV